MVLEEMNTAADDGYDKVCKIKSLLAECMVPPRESQFLNLDRYIEEENEETVIPDPPNWSNISFRGFQERVLSYRPQHWGADPNAVLWLSKYGWRCTEKFIIKCDICSSTIECPSLIQKPELWRDIAHKAHDDLCYWSYCPCPDRFIQIVTHPKILCKNICCNWKKIIAYGTELPRIQQVVLDKMGLTKHVLEHLFRIIESDFSEEGVSALILVICGWLKSAEDKTLECAYCQRHLALRHFISITDISKMNDSLHVEEDLSSETNEAEMKDSEKVTDTSLSSGNAMDTSLESSGVKIETVCSLQQRKQNRTGSPAIHVSTARHRAIALACVTKRKFPSYSTILHLRYGIALPRTMGNQRKINNYWKKLYEDNQNTDKLESSVSASSQGKSSEESHDVNMIDANKEVSVSNEELPGKVISRETMSGDQKSSSKDSNTQQKPDTEEMEIAHVGGQEVATVTEDKISKEGTVSVTKIHDTEDAARSESVNTSFDSEMVTESTDSQDATQIRKTPERDIKTTDPEVMTAQESAHEGTSTQKQHPTISDEVSHQEQRLGEKNSLEKQENGAENEKVAVLSATTDSGKQQLDNIMTDSLLSEKSDLTSGKRQLDCDDDQETQVASKRLKGISEHQQLKKKDINPVNEHRFWCIWRIKTVDRLLGTPKEGWRQILDLLKVGVSPRNSDTEEEDPADLFEQVKKIHYMMTDW